MSANNIGYNKFLFNKRLELNFSRGEVADKIDTNRLSIYLYEHGYLPIPEKVLKKLLKAYGLETNYLDNDLLYPESIKEGKQTEGKLNKLIRNKWTKITSAILLAASIVFIPIGVLQINDSVNNILKFFSHDLLTFREEVLTKGEAEVTYVQPSHYIEEIDIESETIYDIKITIPDDESYVRNSGVTYSSITMGSDSYLNEELEFSYTSKGTVFSYTYQEISGENTEGFTVGFMLEGTNLRVTSVVDGSTGEEYTDQDFQYFLYTAVALATYQSCEPKISKIFDKYVSGYSLPSFISDLQDGDRKYNASHNAGAAYLIVGATLAAAFASLIVISFALGKVEKYQENIDLVDSSEETDKILHPKKKANLVKNSKLTPVLPEFFMRFLVIFALVLFSTATYMVAKFFIDLVSGVTMILEPGALDRLASLDEINTIASVLLGCGLVIHMFTKIDILISSRKYIVNACLMFVAGVLFYIFEVTLSFSLQNGINNFSAIITFLSSYLPGNIFWSIGVYSLFLMFLFSTPKAVEKSKIKTRLWRAGVIIPLLYLFGSSAYGLVTKMKWAPRLPYYLSYLLYPKGMFITLFVLIFATALFIYRRYITTKYGKKNFELYVRGNRYAFIKNIIASSTLVILVVIDFGLSKCIDPETGSMYKVVDALDLGDNYHCLCIIVPILLYRPHFGSRLSLYDTGYSTLYGISYSLGYVLIAISMLPYMSTLLPILEVILESLLF